MAWIMPSTDYDSLNDYLTEDDISRPYKLQENNRSQDDPARKIFPSPNLPPFMGNIEGATR
ncbi:hypothetical protein NXW09_28340 [Bacteroides ovatus]|nr:hypothetical protein [Bacteroides ovatus]